LGKMVVQCEDGWWFTIDTEDEKGIRKMIEVVLREKAAERVFKEASKIG